MSSTGSGETERGGPKRIEQSALRKTPRRGHQAGYQFQYRCRDDAERPFRSDEELAKTVSGIILAQTPQSIPSGAVG